MAAAEKYPADAAGLLIENDDTGHRLPCQMRNSRTSGQYFGTRGQKNGAIYFANVPLFLNCASYLLLLEIVRGHVYPEK